MVDKSAIDKLIEVDEYFVYKLEGNESDRQVRVSATNIIKSEIDS